MAVERETPDYYDPAELARALTNLSKWHGFDNPAKDVGEFLGHFREGRDSGIALSGDEAFRFVKSGELPLYKVQGLADLKTLTVQQAIILAIRDNAELIAQSPDRLAKALEVAVIAANWYLEHEEDEYNVPD